MFPSSVKLFCRMGPRTEVTEGPAATSTSKQRKAKHRCTRYPGADSLVQDEDAMAKVVRKVAPAERMSL